MAVPPESTKASLSQRPHARATARWPRLTDLRVRYRGQFAYVEADSPAAKPSR